MTIEVADRPSEEIVETMPDRLALPIWTLIAPGLGLIAVLVGLAKMGTLGTAAAVIVLIGSARRSGIVSTTCSLGRSATSIVIHAPSFHLDNECARADKGPSRGDCGAGWIG